MDVMVLAAVVGTATPILTAVAATIASKSAVKATLNGTVARVVRLEASLAAQDEKFTDRHLEVVDRLARIETKLEE